MVNRILLAVLLLFASAHAQDAFDPATIMPPETLAYAEFDAAALHRGFNSLDLVRVLVDPAYKNFFAPLMEGVPIEDLKTMKPVRDWVAGSAALGLTGCALHLRGVDGKYRKVRFAPGVKVDPAIFNLMMIADMTRGAPGMIVEFEGVAVIEPGDKMRDSLDRFLQNPPMPFTHKFVQRGARQILTLKFEPFREEGIWYAPEIHADLTGDRWILASSAELLRSSLERRKSLLANEEFVRTRARHTSGERVMFMYADGARLLETAKPLIPELVGDAMELNGLSSIRNTALGVSIVDGGVRESFGVGLEQNPTGFWRLLEAFPPGVKSIHKFPNRALGLIAVKADLAKFDKLFAEVMGELFPGIGMLVRLQWQSDLAEIGIDYDADLLPAFGDERALAFFPTSGWTPDMLLGADLRDRAAFDRLITKITALLAQGPVQLRATEEGWKVSGPIPAELRIHEGHLLGCTSKSILRRVIADWEAPEKTLARDSEVFTRVMKAMNGGKTDDMVVLAYGDMRNWLPHLLAMGAMVRQGPFNWDPMPDIRKLSANFSGLAVGVRRDANGIAIDSFGPIGLSSLLTGTLLFSAAGPVMVAEARR
ncbi:MAG: hypothetical protein ACYTHK_04020 [Planctomycetota bacterium]|jgi:hypothetical protein